MPHRSAAPPTNQSAQRSALRSTPHFFLIAGGRSQLACERAGNSQLQFFSFDAAGREERPWRKAEFF